MSTTCSLQAPKLPPCSGPATMIHCRQVARDPRPGRPLFRPPDPPAVRRAGQYEPIAADLCHPDRRKSRPGRPKRRDLRSQHRHPDRRKTRPGRPKRRDLGLQRRHISWRQMHERHRPNRHRRPAQRRPGGLFLLQEQAPVRGLPAQAGLAARPPGPGAAGQDPLPGGSIGRFHRVRPRRGVLAGRRGAELSGGPLHLGRVPWAFSPPSPPPWRR